MSDGESLVMRREGIQNNYGEHFSHFVIGEVEHIREDKKGLTEKICFLMNYEKKKDHKLKVGKQLWGWKNTG